MADSDSEDMRVMDMVRMFLAASKRGDHALLILESRKQQLKTKYRSEGKVAGVSVPTITSNKAKRKENPARAKRSRLRLEQFIKKKEEEKLKKLQDVGNHTADEHTSSRTSKLVLQLNKEREVEVTEQDVLHSPIPQVDGDSSKAQLSFCFKSDYGEEDILMSLEEAFPEDQMPTLRSRVRLGAPKKTADHYCIVDLKLPAAKRDNFVWPDIPSNVGVFRDVQKLVL